MTITLSPEIERALTEQAERLGTTPELLALDSLRERFVAPSVPEETPQEGTLYDFLQGYIGVIHSSEYVPGGAQMSKDTGRKFAEGMLKKRQAGKL
jgi:hypothetical protein